MVFLDYFLAISRKDKNVVTSILNALPKLAATHHLDNEQVYKFLSAKNRTSSHVLYHVMANGDADMLKNCFERVTFVNSHMSFD